MQSQLFLKILLIYLLFFIFDQTTHNMRENFFLFLPFFSLSLYPFFGFQEIFKQRVISMYALNVL